MTPPSRFRVPLHLQELIRGLHPDLKRKVRAALDVIRGADNSRAPLQAGLLSAMLCMAAQRSEERGTFEPVGSR